ncbi:MAG TPA: PaaI family thioesterase [Candidatus Binatia bacterium]|nr:PaaI family thioesterase [Candidatus Binatia bacterium]
MSEPHQDELLFPFGDGGCFGCSRSNADGLHLRFFRVGDEVRATYRIPEKFHGAPGIAHGGIVATILDEFSCAAAVFLGEVRVVTGELNVRYEQPCPVEQEIEVAARIASREHPRYLVIEAEVRQGARLLVRSTGKFFSRPMTEPAP